MQTALLCLSDGNSATARGSSGFWFWVNRVRLPPRVYVVVDRYVVPDMGAVHVQRPRRLS